jgi:hypothetical protein
VSTFVPQTIPAPQSPPWPICVTGERFKGIEIMENLLKILISEEESDIKYPLKAEHLWYVCGYLNDQPSHVCVFITAGSIIKLCAGGRGGQ